MQPDHIGGDVNDKPDSKKKAMKIQKASQCVAILMLLSSALHAQDKPLRLKVFGDITIDEGGNVASHKIETPVSKTVQSLIERTVKKWKFEPVLREGSPVYAKSGMKLEVVAIPVEGGLQLRVDKASFRAGRRARRMTPPQYPTAEHNRGFSAEILLAVRVDGAGDVRDTFVAQSMLKSGGESVSNSRANRNFEKAALVAAKTWKFEPADLSMGEEADATLIVPVEFMREYSALAASGCKPGEAGAKRLIPWMPASEQDYDPTGLKTGEMLSLGSSPVKLMIPLPL